METLLGRVRSGKGEHARWMKVYADAYRLQTGKTPVPGTLNIELEDEWRMPKDAEAFDAGVKVYIVPCLVNNVAAFIIRTDKNERGMGDHSRNIIELVADVHLRDALGIDDGDVVRVSIAFESPHAH